MPFIQCLDCEIQILLRNMSGPIFLRPSTSFGVITPVSDSDIIISFENATFVQYQDNSNTA